MSTRNNAPARVLALLALLVGLIALVVVVFGSLGGDGDSRDRGARIEREAGKRGGEAERKESQVPRTYEVQEGDNLSLISERTGVPIERIQALNPGVDDLTLQIGARLKLR